MQNDSSFPCSSGFNHLTLSVVGKKPPTSRCAACSGSTVGCGIKHQGFHSFTDELKTCLLFSQSNNPSSSFSHHLVFISRQPKSGIPDRKRSESIDGDATRPKQRSARGRFNDALAPSRQRPRRRFEMYIISDQCYPCVHLPAVLLSVSVII